MRSVIQVVKCTSLPLAKGHF